MIKDKDILEACRKRLLTVRGLPGRKVWMNRGGEPPDELCEWMRDTLIVSDERQTASDTLEKTGVYQVDIFVPKGAGTELVMGIADRIKDAFDVKTSLSSTIAIDRSTTLSSRSDDTWFWIPIQVLWRAYSVGN